ncbi:MAG: methyltransferase domain-containing protein [Acidimicrobiales bacterium]
MVRSQSEVGLEGAARPQRLVFGEVAELYDKARPSYPPALVDHLMALATQTDCEAAEAAEAGGVAAPGARVLDVGCGTGKARNAPAGARVLDVGCGTGKAAVLLAARGLAGIGVEPDSDMASVARRNLAPYPSWSVEAVEFEAFSQGMGTYDLITCGQAWHWLDPVTRYSHAARLLRPGGWLALFWNRATADDSALGHAMDQVYAATFRKASNQGQRVVGRPDAGEPAPGDGFEPTGWQVFPWVARYTTAQVLELVQTHSDHRLLSPGDRQNLLDRLAEIIDAHGSVFDHPYECWLWTGRRQ